MNTTMSSMDHMGHMHDHTDHMDMHMDHTDHMGHTDHMDHMGHPSTGQHSAGHSYYYHFSAHATILFAKWTTTTWGGKYIVH